MSLMKLSVSLVGSVPNEKTDSLFTLSLNNLPEDIIGSRNTRACICRMHNTRYAFSLLHCTVRPTWRPRKRHRHLQLVSRQSLRVQALKSVVSVVVLVVVGVVITVAAKEMAIVVVVVVAVVVVVVV